MLTPDDDLTPTAPLIAYLQSVQRLSELATAGIWEDPAPDRGDQVYVSVLLQNDTVQKCGGGCRWHDCLYAIKAYGPSSLIATIRAAQIEIDRAVVDGQLTWPGWHLMGRWLEQPIRYHDPKGGTGVGWSHRGGQYRLMVEERCTT